MKTAEELMKVTLKRGLAPIRKISVSEWADKYRMLPSESAEPGRWRTSRVPYMKEIMDAVTEAGVERIIIKSAAQVGKSEVLLNVIGRYAHVDPSNIMIIQPTLEMSQDFSKSRLSKMIADTKVLTPLFYGAKDIAESRNSNQTILSKFYVGGRIVLAGANSPAGLASRPIRILLCDEVDRFPPSASSEGDPLSIASKRTSTYWNRKIVMCSTPTVKDVSRIDLEYELGTKEHWAHECPNCGEYHTIEHSDIDEQCRWVCPDCGYKFDEQTVKQAKQKYIVDNPDVKGIRSFYINGFYSPWVKWTEIMREWSEARGKPDLEKVVFNTRFGLSYERRSDVFEDEDEEEWLKQREQYDNEVPSGVQILTAGVDVQQNRLEYEIVGWGEGEECWGICRGQVFGSPQDATTWLELDARLDRVYRTNTGRLNVARTFVDSGYMTTKVYEYCSTRLYKGRLPIKGIGSAGRSLIYRTDMKHGMPLTILGVNEGKAMIYERLKLKESGAQKMHFPADDEYLVRRYDEVYFKQLMAEHRVIRMAGGMMYETYEPIKRSARNEALDLRVYALAAMKSLNIDWEKLKNPTVVVKKKKQRSLEGDYW